jgi:hypothetical protein
VRFWWYEQTSFVASYLLFASEILNTTTAGVRHAVSMMMAVILVVVGVLAPILA